MSLQEPSQTFLTTHQVAVMFGVTVATVANWVDTGKLRAHRTGGGHRRIARGDLATFARSQGREVPNLVVSGAHARVRVLVVDDSRTFLDTVEHALRNSERIEVVTAHTPFLAGLEMASEPPDFIVLDLMMPDIDGFDMLELIRSRPELAEIPVVACTAFADAGVEQRARAAGFTAFLPKPIAPETFEAALNELVERRAGRNESRRGT